MNTKLVVFGLVIVVAALAVIDTVRPMSRHVTLGMLIVAGVVAVTATAFAVHELGSGIKKG